MIESHYSLNVATWMGGRWSHYCRINLGSFHADAIEKARTIADKFGDKFKCELTYVECVGHMKEF